MIRITIPKMELFNEKTQQFSYIEEQTLELEHSLVSISKWESKWCKAFLGKKDKTYEETLDYIRCMTLNPDVDPTMYNYLTDDNINEINNYIKAPMTASHITTSDDNGKTNRDVVTSELIYFWMISLGIPFKCENWHLNRLLALIKVCNAKNSTPKKSNPKALASKYAAMNAARRKQHNSRG